MKKRDHKIQIKYPKMDSRRGLALNFFLGAVSIRVIPKTSCLKIFKKMVQQLPINRGTL